MRPLGVLETVLYCPDLESAERFYGDVLGLERVAGQAGRHVFFRCGPAMLLVFNPDVTASEASYVGGAPVPRHGARGPGHVAFRVPAGELAGWRRHLARHGVAIESEVPWPRGGESIYVRDPAGNSVELATAAVWGLGE